MAPPFPLRHLLVFFRGFELCQCVPSAPWHLPRAHLSKINLVNGNFPKSFHLKSVFTQSTFWNVCRFTIVRMSTCLHPFGNTVIHLSSFEYFKYFQIQNLPFMNFTLCHMQFVKCVPLGVLAYILLFKDYFKRICAPYGPMKQIS